MRARFSEHIMNVFNQFETDYESIKNLMVDLALKKEIFDAEGNKVSKSDAEARLRELNMAMFGLSEGYTARDLKRAMRDHGRQWFDVIEEVVDMVVTTGFNDSEWFNNLVEYRNLKLGQDNLFVTHKDMILDVAKVGTSHHDHILQRYNAADTFTIPTARYCVAVGADINRYMAGQEDWDTLVNAIARAYMVKIQTEIFAQIDDAASKLPVTTGFVNTGALNTTTKADFDEIVENVSAANDNASVAIFGTKSALRQLSNLVKVDWIAASQKESVAMTGRLGFYEGTLIVETPQKFANNDMTTKLFNDRKLYIMPMGVENKIVSMYDVGETEIDEITEKGEANGRIDDIMKYEVQRTFGIGTMIGRYFGQWTLPASN